MTDPRRRDRTRPLELLGISAALAIFVGIFVFVGTRELDRALIAVGVAFVVALVVLAMLVLATGPKDSGGDDQAPPRDDAGDDKKRRGH